jgi:hypothetical protein
MVSVGFTLSDITLYFFALFIFILLASGGRAFE